MSKNIIHLGGLSANKFLREYWQKKPLLIRDAFPHFVDPLTVKEVLSLSGRDEAESRLITRRGKTWTLEHGPFLPAQFQKLKNEIWTVLVQDTQHFSFEAHRLLQQFNFIPHARIDDLMVSYAKPGAGVGPHVDSYDVFLLQGVGQRRWQISVQVDSTQIENAPLKILKHFKPEQEWLLNTGDMLYLPPGYSHHGVAKTECLTWSIGFRAPTHQECATAFLDHLRDEIKQEGQYADPDLQAAKHPGEISRQMIGRIANEINKISWSKTQLQDFIGCTLTEPKSHVYFDAPDVALTAAQFEKAVRQNGIALALKTRMLFHQKTFFINGEKRAVPMADVKLFKSLADDRALPATRLSQAAVKVLYNCFQQGYVTPWRADENQ